MHIVDLCDRVVRLTDGVLDDGAARVQRATEGGHLCHPSLHPRIVREPTAGAAEAELVQAEPPGFDEHAPQGDRRVPRVALQHRAPRRRPALQGGWRGCQERRHLAPEQKAQAIGPREHPRVFQLHVESDHVEAHRLGRGQVPSDDLLVRVGPDPVGVVAL